MTNNSSTPGDSNKKGKGTPDDPFEPDAVYGPDGRRADGGSTHNNNRSSDGYDRAGGYSSRYTSGSGSSSGFGGLGSLMSESPIAAVASKGSGWLALLGGLATVVGLVVAIWPHAGISVFAWAAGIFSILAGGTLVWFGLTNRSIPVLPGIGAFFGILLVLAGIGALISPQSFGAVIVIAIGFMALAQGFTTFSTGRVISRVSGSSSYLTWSGILSIILGVIFIIAPLTNLYSLTILMGIMLAAFGVMMIIAGVRGRRFFSSSRR